MVERVRELKLLKATAESGLLEALEAKGLTLSKLEKLLPLIDEANLLPLLVKNKNLLLAAAPLLVEPAPALLPVVVSVLKTPASSFQLPGAAFLGLGAYELFFDNGLLGVVCLLLGLPLTVLGALLGADINVPTVTSSTKQFVPLSAAPKVSANRPTIATKAPASPIAAIPVIGKAAPKAAAAPRAAPANRNGARKTIKVKVR